MFLATRRRAIWPFIVIPIIFFIGIKSASYYDASAYLPKASFSVSYGKHAASSTAGQGGKFLNSTTLREFWVDLRDNLEFHHPHVAELKAKGDLPEGYIDPNSKKYHNDREPLNLIEMSVHDFETLHSNHMAFKRKAEKLGPRLPYVKNTRGIVMAGGGKYTGIAVTSILLLRRTGSKLPVQLFIDSRAEYDAELCDETLPRLNAECMVIQDILGDDKVEKYQYKVLSILFSPFQHILFLDADAWPIHDPTFLFEQEPFLSNGLVTWPDFWLPSASPIFFDITGIERVPIESRRTSESGVLMYNKGIHAESLVLSSYYNWYGPNCYYTLLSQGAAGEGDKETFMQAALALDKPFWDVKTPSGINGRWLNGSLSTYAIIQMDPVEDYELQQYKKKNGGIAKQGKDGKDYPARPMFVHHNLWKMDIKTLGAEDSPIAMLDKHGHQTRLWGEQATMNQRSGFDVEESMWRTILEANCQQTFLEECHRLRKYYNAVFEEHYITEATE